MSRHDHDVQDLPRLTLPRRQHRGHAERPKGPHALDFRITRSASYGNSQAPIPERLLLIRPVPGDSSNDQLFLDHLPLPRDAWRFDEHDRVLSWRGPYGGGHLYLTRLDLGAIGNIGAAHDPVSVTASTTARFLCDVALNVGATYVSSGDKIVGLQWDTSSPAWKSAQWIQKRLLLSYTVTSGNTMEPPTFTFEFTDQQTRSRPWDPMRGEFVAALELAERSGKMVWDLAFESSVSPDPDKGIDPPKGPDTVYPYWLQAAEDAAAATIDGVLQIDAMAPRGTLVGMQGVRAQATASGFYRTAADAAPFGVFDGRLTIDGRPAGRSYLHGRELHWSDLDPEHQKRTGLPERGSLNFTADGSRAAAHDRSLAVSRLRAGAVADALARHSDLHPTLHRRATEMTAALDDPSLTIDGLTAMQSFVQDPTTGAWGNAVQAAVTSDISNIMNSCIPDEMWTLIFPNQPQPKLSGELATVADTPVEGYPKPRDWYSTLATAVLSQGLSNGSDEACALLNGPRAAAWLKTQVAASKVYNTHAQMLFNYEWQQRNTLTSSYLDDQIANAATYAPLIDAEVTKQIDDIKTNIVVDANTPKDLIAKLTAQVQDAGNYAKSNHLYWPFAFYVYNTKPDTLGNIQVEMSMNAGAGDSMKLSRLIQQNMEVLTALDPSSYFARQYTATLNIFLATNILPNMFGFTGDAMSFDVIKEYLQKFVENNIHSEDQQIAEVAQQIAAILADQNADAMLKASIEALRLIADALDTALALPYVAETFVDWFSTNCPKFSAFSKNFGTVFLGGIGSLAVLNILNDFKEWNKLTAAEKAQVIVDATQLALQVVAAVVKRGIRVRAIFSVYGMTPMQRIGALGRIIVSGEAEKLDEGLVKIGNAAARWIGDTAGSVGKVITEGEVTALLENAVTDAAESASWASRILGKNLDEFIATRIGPVFIIAGIGFSLYSIIAGKESGVALASDILNIVGGSLMLFATVGEWLIEGGIIAAEGLMATIFTIAGPLAVLAAIAGVALMLYQMFKKPPDPVEDFVTKYARPAGFAVPAKSSAIDYALVYANPDQQSLLMIGFTLSAGAATLACNDNGSISLLDKPTALPNCVWIGQADGLGQSQIMTIAQPKPDQPPVALWLSLLSDNSVSFQPKLQPASPKGRTPVPSGGPTVVTQTWLSAPQGNAAVTSKGQLSSVNLTFRAVPPDASGNYSPEKATGWLSASSNGVAYSTDGPGTSFTLRMSGMAPNYMKMSSLDFILNTQPSTSESFGPSFGMPPSTPRTWSNTGQLPAFLAFDDATGTYKPNGQTASPQQQYTETIAVFNALGTASVPFTISVAPPPQPPKIDAPPAERVRQTEALPQPSPALV